MKKLLKRWVPLFMALALVVGAVNNNYLTVRATESSTQTGGGMMEADEADVVLPESEETAGQSEAASAEAESVDADAFGDDAGSSLPVSVGEMALMALSAADVPVVHAANITPAGDSTHKSYTGDQLSYNWGQDETHTRNGDKWDLSLTTGSSQVKLELPAEIDLSKCKAITYYVSAQSGPLNFQIIDNVSYGNQIEAFYYKTGATSYRCEIKEESKAKTCKYIMVQASGSACTCTLDGIVFEMEGGSSTNITPAGDATHKSYTSDQLSYNWGQDETHTRNGDKWDLSLTTGSAQVKLELPAEIDLSKCKAITYYVSAQDGPLNFQIIDNVSYGNQIEAFYYKTGATSYRCEIKEESKAKTCKYIMVQASGSACTCTLDGIVFEMEGDGSGDTPTPSDNLTKPVSAGNTGVALPATSANMNSYYASNNVTHTGAANGVQTVTYPSGYNQIQFTLGSPVDLTQYNQVTFTATGATKPVKFGLHYWSDETGTIDIWSSASSQPTADGYYTFELNPDLLGDTTTATTISVWSNGDAQTFDFHGITFENNPNKTFAETREETFTADQLTTSAADAKKANGAWTVNFSGQDQDVIFNLPESIDMSKCLGITLHITTVNGPVNLFVSKDGNKLESYWNTHSANGVVSDSSISATGAINQFGVQAGRENDVPVMGTITFTGITFLMSGPKLENPVVKNNTTTCSAGCFDFDNAEKDPGVTASAQMTADGKRVEAEVVTFGQAGLDLTVEIPATVDVNYLKSVAAKGQFPGVTVSLLNGDKNVIKDADSSNIITLSKHFTGAKYIRFTSTAATTMTLTGIVFNTEVPIVLNGDFADADVNVWSSAAWSPSAVTAESAASPIVGGVSTYGKITGRNSPYQCFAQDITARVKNGQVYKFSFWAKLSDDYKDADDSLRTVTFSPYYFDMDGKEQYGLVPGGDYKQCLKVGEWTYFEGTVKVPDFSTGFVIRIMEQGTAYGQGECLRGEYYVTGVKMWETDREDPVIGGGGGGGGGSYGSNNRVPTKESKYEITYEVENLEVSWASGTTKTAATGTRVNFSNNYDEARFKLPRPLDMSLCAFLQVKTSGQNVPIAIKLYKNGSQVQVDYYNQIGDTYMFIPTFEGNIDAVGIMSLATPNPAGATVTVDSFTFGFTQELPPYVPPAGIVWNGDFADEDLSDWYAAYWDNVTITRETAKTPIYDDVRTYATYSRRTSPYQCFAQDITDRVEQGETYTFSFWAKLSNDYKDAPPEQRVVQFAPYTEDKSGVADYNPRLEGTYSQTLEPGVWTYFEGTYKVTNENPIGRVVIRILEQGTNYGQGDCVKGSYSIAGVKMDVYIPEPPSIDEDVPNLRDETAEDFGSDFLMGTAMGIGEVDDIGIEMLIKKHFNAVTIGNELKPDALFGYSNSTHTELETITFNGQSMEVPTLNYTRAEELLNKILEWNEAQPDKPIKVRGHVLVWHSQTPEWFFREGYTVKQNADGTENYVTPEVMNLRLEWYIKTVLEHFTGEDSPYKDLFYGWDVVNEAVADTGVYRSDKVNTKEQPGDDTHSNNSSWWAVYHSNEFIVNAFKYANKYAPADLELYYNDYNDSEPNKVKGISLLLSDVLAEEGTRIDAMGMQCHYTLGHPTLQNMEKAIRAYAEIVGTVQLTEFDLKAAGNIGTAEGLEKEYQDQAVRYHEIYEMLKKLNAEDGIEISGFTVWGTIDSHSWLQSSSSVGGGADGTMSQCPLLFDSNYKVKPAYWALVDYSKVDPEWKEAGAELPEETESSQEPEQSEEPSSEEELKAASVAAASPKTSSPIPIIIAVCVAVAAAGGGAAYAFLRKKKEGGGADRRK